MPEESAFDAGRAFDFFDVKGVAEQVVSRFEMRGMYFDRFPADAGLTPEWLHPYRAARVVADGVTAGWIGQLHPDEAAARKIRDTVLVAELYLDRLYKLPLRRAHRARDLALSAGAPRFFPGFKREHCMGDD